MTTDRFDAEVMVDEALVVGVWVAWDEPVVEAPVGRRALAASSQGLTVDTLRELIRNHALWRAVYESDGVDIIPLPDGSEISIQDVEYLMALAKDLPFHQQQAIQLCLVLGRSEDEAARELRLEGSSPVASHATLGLRAILSAHRLGLAPSMAKVNARAAVRSARAEMARAFRPVDFGPAAEDLDYGEWA